MKYRIVKTEEQYKAYVAILEELLMATPTQSLQDEIDLLTFLIEKWDNEHSRHSELDPVMLIKALMKEHGMKSVDLAQLLHVSKSLVSEILGYKKGLSKDIIRKLANHFKLSQEAFTRTYKLHLPINAHLRNASVMNTQKKLADVH